MWHVYAENTVKPEPMNQPSLVSIMLGLLAPDTSGLPLGGV